MNIRQILAGGLAAIAAGATIAFGAFGAGLGDYVVTDTAQLLSPMIVIGGSATAPPNAADVLGGIDVGVAVAGYATKLVTVAGAAGVPSVTDGGLITSDLNKTYIGKTWDLVKSTVTDTELPVLLATGTFIDLNTSEISYQSQIEPGSGLTVSYGTTVDFQEPFLYTTFGSTGKYNTTVLFLGGLDPSAVGSDYSIELFGSDFTFGPTSTQGLQKLTLYSSVGAQTVSLTVGGSVDVTVEGSAYTIEMFAYQTSPAGVALKINGASTTPTVWIEGGTYSLPGSTTKILVNDVSVLQQGGAQGGMVTGSCQLFIGTSKIVFEDGMQIYKNDVVLTNTRVAIENTSSKIIKLEVEIGPDMDNNLKDGESFTDPVWGTFKWNLGGMTPGITSDVREQIKIDRDGSNRVKLTFTNRDGNENGVDVLYGTGAAFSQTVDGTHAFHTKQLNSSESGWQNIAIGDYFVVNTDKRTRIFKYDTYYPALGKEYVQFSDIGSGVIYKVYYKTDSFLRIGTQTHNVSYDSSTHSVAVDLSGGDPTWTANVTVSMYTREEAQIELDNPYINITESPLYTIGNDPTGKEIPVRATYSAANGALFTVVTGDITMHDVGTTFEDKGITEYGTYVDALGDSVGTKNIVVYYPGKRPAYANVAVGANPSIVVGEAAGGTVEQAVKITQPVAKFASEISSPSGITSDLILIGGPCANSLVATLMNTTLATCFADWQAYNGGITEGIIKEFTDAFGSGQKALVVAGTDAADTRNMAAKVMQGTLAYQN